MRLYVLAYFPFLLAWLPAPPLPAQTPELDSLERLANNSADTARIDALQKWASRLRQSDPDRAIEVYATASREAEKLGDLRRQLKAMNSIGISYGMKEDYARSLETFRTVLHLHLQAGNGMGVADAWNNLGIVHKYTGDYPRSLEAYHRALHLYDSLAFQTGRGACLHNIGVVHDLMGEPDKALDFFHKALKIKESADDEVDYSLTLHSIALILEKQGKYDEALPLLLEHLAILRKHNEQVLEANALNTIGKLYVSMGAFEAAETYLLQARERSLALDLRQPLGQSLLNLAQIQWKKNNPKAAVPLLEQHLQLAAELNSFEQQQQGHELFARALADLGDYRRAYEHRLFANTFRDSLFNVEKNESLRQWQARLDVQEKDRLLGEQQRELDWLGERLRLSAQLRWALGIALVLAVAAAVLFFQKNKLRQRTNRALEEKNRRIEAQRSEIEAMNLDLEKRMLRSQLNPHFIFNALGSIQHFITANDRANALRFLSKFSSLLRQVLEDSIAHQIVLDEEVQLLKTYLDLEALRFDQGFQYHIHLDPELDPFTTEMPILLVQPFLENAILHGLLPKQGGRRLDIYFSSENEHTICRILDNGIGRAAAAKRKAIAAGERPSRGIEVAKKRLAALDKSQNGLPLVEIKDLYHPDGSAAGTEVVVRVP